MYRFRDKLRFYGKALGIAGRKFAADDCITVAGSISFVFLLGIIPFSALFLLLLNLFKKIFLPGLFPDNMSKSWWRTSADLFRSSQNNGSGPI